MSFFNFTRKNSVLLEKYARIRSVYAKRLEHDLNSLISSFNTSDESKLSIDEKLRFLQKLKHTIDKYNYFVKRFSFLSTISDGNSVANSFFKKIYRLFFESVSPFDTSYYEMLLDYMQNKNSQTMKNIVLFENYGFEKLSASRKDIINSSIPTNYSPNIMLTNYLRLFSRSKGFLFTATFAILLVLQSNIYAGNITRNNNYTQATSYSSHLEKLSKNVNIKIISKSKVNISNVSDDDIEKFLKEGIGLAYFLLNKSAKHRTVSVVLGVDSGNNSTQASNLSSDNLMSYDIIHDRILIPNKTLVKYLSERNMCAPLLAAIVHEITHDIDCEENPEIPLLAKKVNGWYSGNSLPKSLQEGEVIIDRLYDIMNQSEIKAWAKTIDVLEIYVSELKIKLSSLDANNLLQSVKIDKINREISNLENSIYTSKIAINQASTNTYSDYNKNKMKMLAFLKQKIGNSGN